MNTRKLKTIEPGKIAQIPGAGMKLVMVLSRTVVGTVRVRPLGEPFDKFFPHDTPAFLVDVQGMAAEMERLSERGTKARRYLLALMLILALDEIQLSKSALEEAGNTNIITEDFMDNGDVVIGIAPAW